MRDVEIAAEDVLEVETIIAEEDVQGIVAVDVQDIIAHGKFIFKLI
jgi:hypothetical protein